MTKTIRYCDRCKKEITPIETWNNFMTNSSFPTFSLYGMFSLNDHVHLIDLCPSCSYDLDMLIKKFMEEKDDAKELKNKNYDLFD